jgi:hypothetical protein
MKNLQIRTWTAFVVVALGLGAVPSGPLPAAQQIPGTNPGQSSNRPLQGTSTPMLGEAASEKDEANLRMEQQREKLQVDDRQKHLLADTARLVQLSNELKDEVDKSGKYVTSVAAIRKAEEIEKLAHSVRDRMKN